jgi:hypothetical protein
MSAAAQAVYPNTAKFDELMAEIEAGLVYAASAIEYQWEVPARAEACRADAQDLYQSALRMLDGQKFDAPQMDEIRANLRSLEQWIGQSKPAGASPLIAA